MAHSRNDLKAPPILLIYVKQTYNLIMAGIMSMRFCEKVKMLRLEEGFTQEELAERTQLPPLVIAAFESGLDYPKTSRTYTKLAEALGTTVTFLMQDERTIE